MRRKIGVVGAAALLLSMTTTSSAGAHHAGNLTANPVTGCGQVVMGNLTLSHDIGPCTGDGLVVGTNSITINLNGWDIIGNGPAVETVPPTTLSPMGDAGIRLEGRTNITVTDVPSAVFTPEGDDGEVREFNSGVFIHGGSTNTVENLDIVDNEVLGLDTDVDDEGGGTDGSGGSPYITDFGDGVHLRNSDANVIRANNVSSNGGYAGIYLVGDSDNNKIGNDGVAGNGADANSVNDNDEPFSELFAKQTSGIRLEPLGRACPNGNVIDGNTVNGNGNDGIQLFACASDNDVMNNDTHANGRNGIQFFAGANNNDVYDNDVRDNGAYTEGDGINVGGSLNDVTSNVVYDNHRDGISLGFCRRNLPTDPIVCPPGLNSSNVAATNNIEGNWMSSNGTPTSNVQPDPTVTTACTTLEPAPTQVDNTCDTFDEGVAHGSGIHAQLNTTANVIRGNSSTDNVVWDMRDDWNHCFYNTWTMNTFGTENPTCIN